MAEKTLSSRLVFEGRAVSLRIDTVLTADGRESTREIVIHADCVAIIPIDADGNILLVKQYRKAAERELLEIPAGGIDPGEQPADAVRREMREETGYLPGKVERLTGFYSAPGFCTEYLHLFLAAELTHSPLRAEDTEGISLVHIKPEDIPELVNSETIRDAKSIAGLLFYLQYRKTQRH